MAINKAMRAALKTLSYLDIDIKKTYKAERKLAEMGSKLLIKPPAYKTWDHLIPCGDHNVPARIFLSPGQETSKTLIFFHGGGWVRGNIDTYEMVCTVMAKQTGYNVVSVDYRLAPENKFPAAVEDCYAACREVFMGHLGETKPEDIALIGDSAGGNLAAAVSLMARDKGEFLPKKQILIYPAVYNDHSETSPYPSIIENGTDYLLTSKRVNDFMELYVSKEDWNNPYFAPLLADSFENQPDTLIITAEYDPLRDEGEAYGRKLRDAGSKVDIYRMNDGLHGFFSLPPSFVHVKRAYEKINCFLDE